jgi:lipopolysaccharide/colanic/teichoic acid biosynthesis glycosyltransferase
MAAKRILDTVAAACALVLVAPILLVAAVAIKLDSQGPILYRAHRVGKDGVLFDMFKLRTMVFSADRTGSALTQGGDRRVTRCGRFLRKWKIDELPQLVNVLRGEMSLVGPRPESPNYVQYYTQAQWQVLTVQPGITGTTQIRFRNEESLLAECADLEKEYVERIMPLKLAMDLEYIRNRSLLGDLCIMVETVASVAAPQRSAGLRQAYPPATGRASGPSAGV